MFGVGYSYGYSYGYLTRWFRREPEVNPEGAFTVDTTLYTADDTVITADRLTTEGL